MSAGRDTSVLNLEAGVLPPVALPGGEDAVLGKLRESAKSRFAELGVPSQKWERWKYTGLRPLAKAEFALPAGGAATESAPAVLENMRLEGADHLIFVNGVFRADLSDAQTGPGVTVQSLAEVLRAGDKDWIDMLAQTGDDRDQALAVLNTALMRDGYVIALDERAEAERPIHIVHAVTAPMAVNMRNLILARKDSRVRIVETYLGDSVDYWTNSVTQIALEAGARLDHFKWQHEAESAFHTANTRVHLAENARYNALMLGDGSRLTRQDLGLTLAGAGADCRLKGVSLARGDQHLDTSVILEHRVPNAHSDQQFKSVLAKGARAVFQGLVKVARGAEGTEAHQKSNNLLLDRSAEADAKPELEIFADDVQCSHGATVGEIDESKLFYLKSRGLDDAAARALLVQGFVAEMFDDIADETVAAYLRAGAESAARRVSEREA